MKMKRPYLTIIIALVVLVVISRLYTKSMRFDIPGFEGFSDGMGETRLVICKADWCGHCKKAMPEFKKLGSSVSVSGVNIPVSIFDADKDKEEIARYKVKGYPTVLLVKGDTVHEYSGQRTADGIRQFIMQYM